MSAAAHIGMNGADADQEHRPAPILIVDDRAENLTALEVVLAPLGEPLIRATSGEEALRELMRRDVAVILLDVQMPGMDGFETATRIKQRERTRGVPIVFLTAISTEAHQIVRGYSSGAVDYVLKPLDPDLLRSKVSVFLDLHRKDRALREREALFRATFEDAPIGMALVDALGQWVDVNRALAALLGCDRTALVAVGAAPLAGGEDARAQESELRQRLLAGRIPRYAVEQRLLDVSGTEIPVEVTASLARGGTGAPGMVLAQYVDLRERHTARRAQADLVLEQAVRSELEAANARLRAIQALSDVALRSLDVDALLDALLARLTEVMSADLAEAVLTGVGSRTRVVRVLGGVVLPVSDEEAEELGAEVAVEALAAREAPDAETVARTQGGHRLTAVLRSGRRVLGALHCTRSGRPFTDDDALLIRIAGERAAIALERAGLFEREHEVATTLQRSLLPAALPNTPGAALAAVCLAGVEGTAVGGDWYDAIPLSGGRLALIVGDIAGRGIEAASWMGQLQSVARAYALEAHPPGEVLRRCNRWMASLDRPQMVTLACAIIEPDAGIVRYANAGHPPLVVRKASGELCWLTEGSVPLGVLPDPQYEDHECELGPGSLLVLYSDGLIERRGESIDAGLQRLGAALSREPDAGAQAVCGQLISDLVSPNVDDDVTVVVAATTEALPACTRLTLDGDPATLVSLRRTLRRWLREAGASEEEVGDVTLAAHEAWQNALEHAHEFSGALAEIVLERNGNGVEITVRDHGAWEDRAPLEDRGHGLAIMHALMEQVEVRRERAGTTIVLRRRLGRPLVPAARA